MCCSDILEEKSFRHRFTSLSHIPFLVHSVFTRHGGVSRPPFDTLNVSWGVGDTEENVCANLLHVRDEMGVDLLVGSPQVHGDTVHVIDESAISTSCERYPIVLSSPGDALVTALRGIGLLIRTADCQAVFLVDPVRKVIGNVHAGWRGSVAQIVAKTVAVMQERFGSRPRDLLAGIGPSLGPCCAEFVNHRVELPESFLPFQVRPNHFDFWAITRRQLTEAGLLAENVEIAGHCTVCEKDRFFSYRGEKKTGRMAAVIAWAPD